MMAGSESLIRGIEEERLIELDLFIFFSIYIFYKWNINRDLN